MEKKGKNEGYKNVLTVYEEKLRKNRTHDNESSSHNILALDERWGDGVNTSVVQHYTNCSAFDCGDGWIPKTTKQVDAKSVEGGYERVE